MIVKDLNDLFEGFLRKHPAAILIVDSETLRIFNANNSALEFYGYSHDEITSINIFEINTMPFEEIKQIFDSISDGKKLYNIRHIPKNGEIRYVNINVDRITINDREYFFEIINDVTEEKKLFSQFKKERELFNKGSIVSIAWRYVAGWPVSYVSENIKSVLGYDKNYILSENFKYADIIHPEDFKKSYKLINRHEKGELPYYECETRLKCKNGEYKWILDKGKVNEFDENNKPVLMYGVHIDIDKLKRIEEELKNILIILILLKKHQKQALGE